MKDILDALDRSNAVIEFQPDGTIITANHNFLTAVGYALSEIKGKHHSMFVDAAERNSEEYQKFWSTLAQGQFAAKEFKRIRKDGAEIWIEASYNPIVDKKGHVYKVVKYASDITAKKLRSAELEGLVSAIDNSQANSSAYLA